jgi:putative hydrolase of the HAD superfamily
MPELGKALVSGVLVFDADNTLWDTDAVFREAQLEMLRVLAHAGLIKEPESELDTLRLLDKALAMRFEKFEYDFIALSAALGHYYSRHVSIEEAAEGAFHRSALSIGKELTSRSVEAFTRTLERIPPMFRDAEEVLNVLHDSRLRGSPIALLMFSDGRPGRLERILEAHNLRKRRIFDDVVIGTKSVESFSTLRELALTHLLNASDPQSTLLMHPFNDGR